MLAFPRKKVDCPRFFFQLSIEKRQIFARICTLFCCFIAIFFGSISVDRSSHFGRSRIFTEMPISAEPETEPNNSVDHYYKCSNSAAQLSPSGKKPDRRPATNFTGSGRAGFLIFRPEPVKARRPVGRARAGGPIVQSLKSRISSTSS